MSPSALLKMSVEELLACFKLWSPSVSCFLTSSTVNCFTFAFRFEIRSDLFVYADGVGISLSTSAKVWRIPFGFQLVPAGILAFGLLTVKVLRINAYYVVSQTE